MQMETFHWKKNQKLAEDYIAQTDKAKALYPYHFGNLEDWQSRVQWLDEPKTSLQVDRGRLVQVLQQYNKRIGNARAAFDQISALADKNALAIVGGQQAGLFGGSLLVLYKAITIVQLAREWSGKLQRPVVPIFWIAGEDHDFDEVNHTYTLSNAQHIEKIKVDHPTGRRTSVSRLPIEPEAWKEALTALDQSLMDTEFKASLIAKLEGITEDGATLSEAFARWMAILFGEYGLVLIDSDEPSLRALEAPMFEKLILENEAFSGSLQKSQDAAWQAGYESQAEISKDGANLFVFADGQRLLLHREGERFTDKKQDNCYTRQQLQDLALTMPENLSNNVMSRPLMQEFLFPVLATVLGPGEIAYWSLTKHAFEQFGMKMPIIAPRMEFTLIEGTVQKQMNKYGFTFEDVLERFEHKKQEWLDAQDTLQLNERFDAVKSDFSVNYAPLVNSLAAINPGVKKLGETNLEKILEQIEYLRNKAGEAYKAQFDAALRQLERIRLTIVPFAKPQERVYNGCAYMNRYGNEWLRDLLETPIPVDGLHRIYYL
ncbi:bacillithiol biosynthesis cysteine-adding enzyme BshC [Paenibacillus sp. Root444D2]|uniref:bacillithiol biosynthesis cysteine-adding enzyme BshC n=1 Tax=Paenibacillus sp. Root444D2 TaxID=1736538 RepID=UPI00070C32AD|nr:bacillithiol biosynthesis cysteine-adding enzyme BshC [Paenibacillus sp. Root444D2]KQX64735.1 bacillithiol biosynthesis cysteine-adding enzyme BshC [Paenibacillus sp. Root444D2]